jgi:transposase
MKKIVKQVAGIDVAQKELVVCLARMYNDLSRDLYAHKVFANSKSGIAAFFQWVIKNTQTDISVGFVMEATGVYHETLAYFLYQKKHQVSIVLPNKISNYMRTLEIKTVTDKTASEAIARFGLERKLDNWQQPKEIYRRLRQLTRERDQLVQERTIVKNQLHAEEAEAYPGPSSIKRIKARIKMLNKQEQDVKAEIQDLISTDQQVKEQVKLMTSIPGIGGLTAAIILAETNGFELIQNRRQLASYAGFDIQEKQSGTSVKGKPRISKRGNKHLRKAMHLPALAAIRYDQRAKDIFVNLVSRHGIKMKAAVAVQRRLLEMTYTIFKTKIEYDRNYLDRNKSETSNTEQALA